jgi:cardiolipin synthase
VFSNTAPQAEREIYYTAPALLAKNDVKKLAGGNARLLVQPGDGVKPLLEAIDRAGERVEIVIFRFDRKELEDALVRAAGRGVVVHALIAYTNRGGENGLRQLEMRLLAKGVTVTRTADDLVRYHAKLMIVDRRELFVLAFNFTYLDMEHSRSFGVTTRDPSMVKEAVYLFNADTKRQEYKAGSRQFLVSPVNSRKELTSFIDGAKKELIIYDPKIDDPAMIQLLNQRAKAGVEIRVIGRAARRLTATAYELPQMRLHTRSIVRDREDVFIGSQSLRAPELETRREVGLLFRDPDIAKRILKTFNEDWNLAIEDREHNPQSAEAAAAKTVRGVAKAMTKGMPPVAPVLEMIAREVIGEHVEVEVDPERIEKAVKSAVKEAVEESVRDAVHEMVGK